MSLLSCPPSEHCVRVGSMLAIPLCTSEPSFVLHSCLYTLDKSGMCESFPLLTPVLDHFPCDSTAATTCTYPHSQAYLIFCSSVCADGSRRASVETKEQKNGVALEIRLTCIMVIFSLSSRPSLPNICCLGWSEEPSHINKPLFSFPVGTDFINRLVT